MAATPQHDEPPSGSLFRNPLWWGALAVLVANDHVLKGAALLPAALTGKLSDFAGLFVAPTVCAALLQRRTRRALLAVHLGIGLVFATLKLVPAAAAAWNALGAAVGFGVHVWCDPTDLIALPMLWASYHLSCSPVRRPAAPSGLCAKLGVLIGGIACLATSPLPIAEVPGRLDAKRVVARALDGDVILDRHTGAIVARFDHRGPGVLVAGRYITVDERELTALDAETLELRWSLGLPTRSEVIACGEDLVVSWRGLAKVLDAASGRERSRMRPDGFLNRCVERTLLSVNTTELVAYDPRSGALLSRHADRLARPAFMLGGSNALVYWAGPDGISALDAETGLRWHRRAQVRGIAATPGGVVVGTPPAFGQILALDPAGSERWRSSGGLLGAHGLRVFVSVPPSGIAALDDRNAGVIWRSPVGGGILLAADGEILVTRGPDTVWAHDARTGALLWATDISRRALSRAPALRRTEE